MKEEYFEAYNALEILELLEEVGRDGESPAMNLESGI
jgi:hypothetical protein